MKYLEGVNAAPETEQLYLSLVITDIHKDSTTLIISDLHYLDQKGVTFKIDVDYKNNEEVSFSNMNSDVKGSDLDNENKNRKILVPPKGLIRPSVHLQSASCSSHTTEDSQLDNESSKKTNRNLPTLMTKQLCCVLAEKGPQIRTSGKKNVPDKHCIAELDKAALKVLKKPRNGSFTKQERKSSRILVSDEKSNISALHKQQSTSNHGREISNDGFTGHVPKKFPHKAIEGKNPPEAKKTRCTNIQSVAKNVVDRTTRSKNETATVEKGRQIDRMKKYPVQTNMKDKTELKKKQVDNGIDVLKNCCESKKVCTSGTIDDKKSMPGKTTCNNDANENNNGAARTRIFRHKKCSQVDKNLTSYKNNEHVKKAESSKSKVDDLKPPLEKQTRNRHEIKNNKSTKKDLKQNSIDSACSTISDNIISLFQRGLSTPKSSKDSDQFQEFRDNDTRLIKEGVNNKFTLYTGSGTSCEIALPMHIEVDLSRAESGTNNGEELITDCISAVDHDYTEMIKSQTVSEVSSVLPDEITHFANSINRSYHSNQQYCKGTSGNQDEKYTAELITKSIKANEKKNTHDDDAKYNLMKALIHPATEIHTFKDTDNHFNELSKSRQKSQSVLTCRNEGFENYYKNSSSNGSMNTVTLSPSNDVQETQNDFEDSKSVESLHQHASVTHFRQSPASNTSDYIVMNSKMKGYKYTKKYRHFKSEEKNMCCNMARYIEKMVSNERKYQKDPEKKVNLEREDVKIIIDEKSPKTSRIKIVNDRSSVSVVCHSLGRIVSLIERKNNVPPNKAESSGGESSGYKSFHNSKTKHFDLSDQVEVKLTVGHENQRFDKCTSHYRHGINIPPHNTSTPCETLESFIGKADVTSPELTSNHLHEENPDTRQNTCDKKHGKQSTDIQYTLSDTNKYLSPFTNCMNVYLPSKITAYQLNEVNGNKMLRFNNDEDLEKDMDDAELRIGEYLISEHSDSEDVSSDEEESSKHLGSVKGNETIGNEIIMLKASNNLEYKSSEMVVDQRFINPDNTRARTDSTDVPAVPAQLKIITSLADVKSVESTSESSLISTDISDVKLEAKNDISMTKVNSSNDTFETNHSSTPSQPITQAVSKNAHTKPGSCRISCFKRFKSKRDRPNDGNTVHELWANKKSTANSTDNESQTSAKSRPGKRDANKLKFNILKKLSASLSEKTIKILPDRLPEPPPPFLESSVPSQSTVLSSTADTESFESDDAAEPPVHITPILSKNPGTEFRTDNPGVHHTKKTNTNAASNGKDNFTQFQANNPTSVSYEDVHTQPGTSAAPPIHRNLFEGVQELHAAAPPPVSAVPPPYPFCCPLAPYMMQHWQNHQQPPPASTVPLPVANWKSNVGINESMPPPPGMVPIPWFAQMPQMNNTLPTGGVNSANNLYAQPPPEWLMMPRGYAPCIPCSKIPDLHLKKTDSSINEEDEPIFEKSENKQDDNKKRVSNKLFKIFRRKNKDEVETMDEDERKGRNQWSRSELKPIQKGRVEQNDKQIYDDRSIWESPDIAGIVTPEEIGRCFRRGFRADGLTLSGDDYLCTRAPSDTASGQEDVFNFSEHDTPLDFLLALGFSVDEATAAIRDDEVRRRFKAALTEARIWVPHIATTQGTLLYLLAMKAKPKVMRYFLQLVESIVNKRITNAVKLDAYLKILEKVEDGYVSFVTLFGKDTGQEDEEDTVVVEKQRRRIFYTIYKYAESEAEEVDRPLTKASVDLLHSLAARYRSAIGPHLRLLACYIGEGLLTKDVQLEAAFLYLSRLDSANVQLADLEKYCGLPPSERRREEQITNEQSPEKV